MKYRKSGDFDDLCLCVCMCTHGPGNVRFFFLSSLSSLATVMQSTRIYCSIQLSLFIINQSYTFQVELLSVIIKPYQIQSFIQSNFPFLKIITKTIKYTYSYFFPTSTTFSLKLLIFCIFLYLFIIIKFFLMH